MYEPDSAEVGKGLFGHGAQEQVNDGADGAAAGRCGNRGLNADSLDDPLLARFGVRCLRSRYSGASLFEIFQTSRESEKVLAFDPSAG